MADDRNIAQSAIEVLKNLRGSGAPLAARTNDIINNLLGPHLRDVNRAGCRVGGRGFDGR
jgi:hypothetical protein